MYAWEKEEVAAGNKREDEIKTQEKKMLYMT